MKSQYLTRLVFFVIIILNVKYVVAQRAEDIISQTPIDIVCGTIIEGEFSHNYEAHFYHLPLSAGDRVEVSLVPIGEQLETRLNLYSPTGTTIVRVPEVSNQYYRIEPRPQIDSGVLSSNGFYTIGVDNFKWNDRGGGIGNGTGGPGVYTLYIGCTLRDGTVIGPGDTIEPSADPIQAPLPIESGFLFPDLPEDGIELPLVQGQSQTIPVGNDIVLYTYDVANADQSATLSISRVSGDISLGINVMNRDTSEIIFLGGMPSSNNLSVELTFPADGTYAIGLFRLDTAERTGTSGAVQIVIE